MSRNVNKVIAGAYKNAELQLKNENADQLVLVVKKILGKTEIPLDKTTIKRYTHSTYTSQKHEIIIEWKDGKISQIEIDDKIYLALSDKLRGVS